MRDYIRGMLIGFVGMVAFVGACPKPGPAPVNPPPDASDASPRPPIPPPAPPVTCSTACAHAKTVCPTMSDGACASACGRIGSLYARCLLAATACEGSTGLGACDPMHNASAGAPKPTGR